MTNRACGCDVSKIVNVRAVKPFLGRRLKTLQWCFGLKVQTVRAASPTAGLGRGLGIKRLQRRGTTGLDKRTTYFRVVKYLLSKALGS